MRLVKRQPLLDFAEQHPTLRRGIATFLATIKGADWHTPDEVIQSFGEARIDTFTNERVCINIGGAKCRVVIKVRYGWGIVYFKWIGLHKDYDKLMKEGKRIEEL